jgi:hypothetical protein
MKELPTREGYSVYAPLSRQEKGVDLLITRRANGRSTVATLQVKYSRAYENERKEFRFAIWFRSFPVPEQADFFVLAALYPNITGRANGPRSSWWSSLMLLFTREELAEFLSGLRTKRGHAERMFYFEFDSPERVVLTRGATDRKDLAEYTLENRLALLREYLARP